MESFRWRVYLDESNSFRKSELELKMENHTCNDITPLERSERRQEGQKKGVGTKTSLFEES